ncbi:MAG: Hsp70 family protein [Deltaproteobacteria bacterium]|nr:Hsp70 family protein [Deltaproteobacteria bacterium]
MPVTVEELTALSGVGLGSEPLLQEPVASAIAYGFTSGSATDGHWLVYDLGGGTFDTSLMRARARMSVVEGQPGRGDSPEALRARAHRRDAHAPPLELRQPVPEAHLGNVAQVKAALRPCHLRRCASDPACLLVRDGLPKPA